MARAGSSSRDMVGRCPCSKASRQSWKHSMGSRGTGGTNITAWSALSSSSKSTALSAATRYTRPTVPIATQFVFSVKFRSAYVISSIGTVPFMVFSSSFS
eukprot:Amastigsp_a508389_369.p6 type:complete len:100 gc:universal Amastigsp_a508389_369:1334-1035(-)